MKLTALITIFSLMLSGNLMAHKGSTDFVMDEIDGIKNHLHLKNNWQRVDRMSSIESRLDFIENHLTEALGYEYKKEPESTKDYPKWEKVK